MIKKFLGIALALVLVLSMGVIGVSAAEAEVAATGADVIYFDASSSGWSNFSQIFCHVWSYNSQDGLDWPGWQSKAEKCTDEGNGVWSYDLSKTGNPIDSGKTYCVIFSADTGAQTYDLCFDTSCIGDTAYCDGTTYENPVDSTKTALAAFWKSGACGPIFQVTSIGNIAGTYIPVETSAQKMYDDFCTVKDEATGMTKLENAVLYDPAGRSKDEIQKAVADALGIDMNASSNNNNTNNNTNNNNNTSSKNNTTSNNNKPSSASGNAATGEGTTIIFVMLGIMLASAGVIFFARKAK